MLEKLRKYFPVAKIDEAAHLVWGCVTSETPDSDGEIADYPATKAQIQKWSDETLAKTTAAGQEPSLGNMRVMHQLQVGGKAIKVEYRDDSKQVWVGSTPANDEVWHLLKGGFLTSHSIGGNYLWKKKEGDYTRYAPSIGEISYVDRGANPDASFAYVKADGSVELRKFVKPGPEEVELLKKIEISDLSTRLEKIHDVLTEFVRETKSDEGVTKMNLEQIKKCAAALGISEEEFVKMQAGELAKAKGLTALHGHISKAISHHESMHKAHGEMAEMHKAHAAHLHKCMKAAKNVMGAEEESEAEKAEAAEELKKAEAAELAKKAAAELAAATADTVKKSEVAEMIAKAVKEALDKVPANDGAERAKLFAVPRDMEAKKAEQSKSNDPLPV